jgi:hypothetical protein
LLRRLGGQKEAGWTVNRRFVELEAAHDWGAIPPHVWDEYPEESRAEMMAYTQVKGQMRQWEDHLLEQKKPPKLRGK